MAIAGARFAGYSLSRSLLVIVALLGSTVLTRWRVGYQPNGIGSAVKS
jgi:hypothetical protein